MSVHDEGKRAYVGKVIDLSVGRYKDYEIDELYDFVNNQEKYSSTSEKHSRSSDGWSSDGKFTRWETTVFTFVCDDSGIYIVEDYQYHDDDGQSGGNTREHRTGREIIKVLNRITEGKAIEMF